MANLLVFGVPMGFSASECDDGTYNFLKNFYTSHNPGTDFKAIRRQNNEVYYILLIYEKPGTAFEDANGRVGSFIGLSLSFKNQYVADASRIQKLLQAIYDHAVKGNIVDERPNGTRRYNIHTLRTPGDGIVRDLVNAMTAILKANPEFAQAIKTDIRPLPPIQNQMQRD